MLRIDPKPLLIACCLLAAGQLCAQEYNFRSYGGGEGLSNLAVQKIYEDRSGFLWVGTENGIFRFDGQRFQSFGPEHGLPDNSGVTFGEAPDGMLLVGTHLGLYHQSGSHFEKMAAPFHHVSWMQGIQSDGKGHTYIGTDAGLFVLSSTGGQLSFEKIHKVAGTSDAQVDGVLVDGNTLWYGCGNSVCRMDRRGTRIFGRENGLLPGRFTAIRKDHEGTLWVQANKVGLLSLASGESHFQPLNDQILASCLNGGITVDSAGRLLVPTPRGLFIHENNAWHAINRTVGLRGDVNLAVEDSQHSLWIGLEGRGLAHWRGYREWESYSESRGLTNELIFEILPQGNDTLWVATQGGLFKGQRQQFSWTFQQVAPFGDITIHSLQMDLHGDLWVGTGAHGLARLHPQTGHVEWFGPQQGLAALAAAKLHFDRERRLWAATETGLYVAQPPYLRFSRITELPSSRIWSIAEGTDGTIWAGGLGGLFEDKAGKWKTITQADGLSGQELLSLGTGPNGSIWVGYRHGGGIDRITPTLDGVTIEKGVQRPGSDGIVYFLHMDKSGNLWAGTDRGVDMWNGNRWTHYDTSDGLAWNDCDLNGFAESPNGTIWIGTSGGLSRFKPIVHHEVAPLVRVVFTQIFAGKKDVSDEKNPSFNMRDNTLVARFTALNTPPEGVSNFRYRLEGANSTWTATTQREIQFANLAPGTYRLEVEALDDDEWVWSEQRAVFPFNILTPWYGSWWFIGLCALIPLLVVAGVIRLRILSVRQRERLLVEMVANRTADLQCANEELMRLSLTDPLTGLANRRVFNQTLERECSRLKRTGSPVSLVMLDVDHFKALNDSEGHQRGDDYLIAIGVALNRTCRRQIDVAARCGGEEFALILPSTDAADAVRLAEEVRATIAALNLRHLASPVAPYLTISAGVATATAEEWNTPEALVAAADRALYQAKGNGRNRVEVAQFQTIPIAIL